MTISSTTNRVSYAGNGSTTIFSFPYKFLANSDLIVIEVTDSTGAEVIKTITTHYTVSGAGASIGGSVTMLVAPATGKTLVIVRSPALTQGLDLVENDSLPAESVEEALDRSTMIHQRTRELVDRSVTLPDGFTDTFDPSLPALMADNPGATIIINAAANGFEVGPTADEIEASTADAAAAAASAAAAAASETAAGASETAAAASASAASTSASNASTSASNASTSASAASTSASAASTSASSASTSASTATTQASNASTSASNASTSASNASTSATNASNSAIAADASADAAALSETAAAASAASAASGVFTTEITLPELSTPTTPASGYGKIYFKSDGFLYQLNDDGTETKVGSGSGDLNYVTNPDIESNINGVSMYADAAATSPVDMTSGSPSSTIARSTSDPLRGIASARMIKTGASNRQGEGWSTDITSELADKYKVMEVSFEYNIVSGTYVDGDCRVYAYDITNGVLIELSQRDLLSNANPSKYVGYFQNTGSTSYRIGVHISSTSTEDYTIDFESIKVSPAVVSASGSSVAFKVYRNSALTNTTFNSDEKISLDTVEFDTAGGWNSGSTRWEAPKAGYYSVQGAAAFTSIADGKVGRCAIYKNGSTVFFGSSLPGGAASTTVSIASGITYLAKGDYVESYGYQNDSASASYSTGSTRTYMSGFLIKSEASDNFAGNSVISARYRRSSALSLSAATYTVIPYLTKDFDTTSSYNTGTGGYTVPESGVYEFKATVRVNAVNAGSSIFLGFTKNGTGSGNYVNQNQFKNHDASGGAANNISAIASDVLNLVKGDVIYAVIYSDNAESIVTDALYQVFTVTKLNSGTAIVAPNETISAFYQNNAGQPIANSGTIVQTYNTKQHDTHSAMDTGTGVYTIPATGYYTLSGGIRFNVDMDATTTLVQLLIQINGTPIAGNGDAAKTTGTMRHSRVCTVSFSANKGDQITLGVTQNSTGSKSLEAAASPNFFSIINK